jgi:large subunit ribosomal protein L21
MYAVVETGGRQYRVSPGDTIDVEKLAGVVGETVTLTDVLMVGEGADVTVGTPRLVEAHIEARIVAQKRGKKIIIFKHKRRKGYRRKQGHRQWLTSLHVVGIHTADVAVPLASEAQVAPQDTSGQSADAESGAVPLPPETPVITQES